MQHDTTNADLAQHPSDSRKWVVGAVAVLFAALLACQDDPCEFLDGPPSAIPPESCPVDAITVKALRLAIDPMTGEPETGPARHRSDWPATDDCKVETCASCSSVCDCRFVSLGANDCRAALANRNSPTHISGTGCTNSCGTITGPTDGSVHCIAGQCVIVAEEGGAEAK